MCPLLRWPGTTASRSAGRLAWGILVGAVSIVAAAAAPAVVTRGQGGDEPSPELATFFEERVLPILDGACFECHTDATGASSELELDSRAGMLAGGERGPAIVPGDPEASLLVAAVRRLDPELAMPPKDPLSPEAVADLYTWIRAGAAWPRSVAPAPAVWWSFRPVADPPPPDVGDATWCTNGIDAFVLARLEAEGLAPVPVADRRTLLRRATFDLIGLPPTPAELAAFLADDSPDAWSRVIDRLLASPRYGEAWGRHWLDLARYADTAGDSSDYPIPDAWRYRNWVIDAFNADVPYDRFLRDQIAGDVYAAESPDEEFAARTVATGFLALARRFGVGKDAERHLTVEDMIDTLGRATMGLTLSCARCHHHKFDPISMEDYYGLYGIFDSSSWPFPGSEADKQPDRTSPLAPPAERATMNAAHERELARLDGELRTAEEARAEAERGARSAEALVRGLAAGGIRPAVRPLPVPDAYRVALATQRDEARAALADASAHLAESAAETLRLTQARAALADRAPRFETAYAVFEGEPKAPRIHEGGAPRKLGETVARGFPAAVRGDRPPPVESGSGRRALAEWLTDPAHPLTARVMVNRIWQHHFGRGLVATPSNFGRQGVLPSHPALLDWLARRFVASGWSVKAMHRLVLHSTAYRLASTGHERADAVDPENRLIWRHTRRRLTGEEVRDGILFVSGELDLEPGGPHPFPPEQDWRWSQHNPFRKAYETNKRTVYQMLGRLRRHPYLALFDGPDTNASTARRAETTVPQQALYLMNSAFVHGAAEALAGRLLAEGGDDGARLDRACVRVLGRPLGSSERSEWLAWLGAQRERLAEAGADSEVQAWAGIGRVLFGSNAYLYVD